LHTELKNKTGKRVTLFDKLLILHLFSTSVLFLIIIVSYYQTEKKSFNMMLMEKSILIHDLLEVSSIDPTVNIIAYDRVYKTIENLYKKNKEITYIEMYDPTAHIFASVGKSPEIHFDVDEITQLFKQHSISGKQTNTEQDYNDWIIYLKAGDSYLGLIKIGYTKKYLEKLLKRNIQFFLGLFIIAIAVTSLIFYLFTNRWIILPIVQVSQLMNSYGQKKLQDLYDIITEHNKALKKDEIGIMSMAFERMILSIITRTKEKEKAEERYRLIAENVADVIWTMDVNFKFTYISPSILQQRGYTVQEAIDPSLDKLMLPNSLKKVTNLHNEKLKQIELNDPAGWEPAIFEIEQQCKDGTIIWTNNNIKFLPGKDGQPKTILGTTRDITNRKHAEAALKKSERNYREIFNASSDAIFIHDGKTGKILDVNIPMLKMYGYEKREVLKLPIETFSSQIAPFDQKGAERNIRKAVEKGSYIFEWQAKKKNGGLFWTEVNLIFSKIGEEERVLASVRDITERKRTQEMMVQSEKMLSVGGLAAGMAHEINNPLAGVMQTAGVMSNRLTNINIPANINAAEEIGINMDDISAFMEKRGILRMISTINESGQRMAAIVNNMLSFARKSDAQVSSYHLAELLDKTLELAATDFDLKKHYDFKKIELKKEYNDNLPPVPCEAAKIQQVLLNILKNGAQAMQEVGIEKPIFIIRTSHDVDQKMVSIEIEDNGPGMDDKTRKRIFEPFFTTKPVGIGTGLGLSVSYFIITENHGGTMVVVSTPGHGAKFIICLPVKGKRV